MWEREWVRVLVSGNTKIGCERLAHEQRMQGVGSCAIHGDKDQWQRERALQQFTNGKPGGRPRDSYPATLLRAHAALPPAINLQSICSQSAINLQSICSQSAVNLQSICNQSAVNLQSICNQSAINLQSICKSFRFSAEARKESRGAHARDDFSVRPRHMRLQSLTYEIVIIDI